MPTLEAGATVERSLLVRLDPQQLKERSAAMAACEIRIEALQLERSSVGTRIKSQVDERKRLAHVVEAEHEEQPVTCEWEPDYTAKMWRLRRTDTSEVVETQPMTAADLQTSFPDARPTNDNGRPQPRA